MRGLGYGVLAVSFASAGFLAVAISTDAVAAGPSGPPTTAGAPTVTGTGGTSPGPQPPSLHYTFDGNTNNILGGHNLVPDQRNNLHFAFVAGRDGKNPGGIEGMGTYQGDTSLFYPQRLTMQFSVFPSDKWDAKNACGTGAIFYDAFLGHGAGDVRTEVPQNGIYVDACPVGGTNPVASVSFLFFVQNGSTNKREQLTIPMSSNAWHTVLFIYDGPAKKMGLSVDGQGKTIDIAGPILPCNGMKNCIINIGGPIDTQRGYYYGTLDDFVFWPSANWPVQMAPHPGVANASVR